MQLIVQYGRRRNRLMQRRVWSQKEAKWKGKNEIICGLQRNNARPVRSEGPEGAEGRGDHRYPNQWFEKRCLRIFRHVDWTQAGVQEANGTPGEFKYKQKHIKKNRLRKKKTQIKMPPWRWRKMMCLKESNPYSTFSVKEWISDSKTGGKDMQSIHG